MADETPGGTGLRFLPAEPEVKTTRVPLPPQLKVEEEQKRVPEKAPAVTVTPPVAEAPKVVKKAAAPEKCPACHTPIPAERAQFSFCTHCGADLPKAGLTLETKPGGVPPVRKPPVVVTEEVLAHGVRDPRATVRKIAQVHAGTAQAQAQTVVKQGSSTQIEFEFRREINPTANAILSFIFPGLGQMLNGQVGKGVLLILAAFVATTLIGMNFWGIEILIARVLVAIDAYRIGEKRRNGQKVGDGDWDIA